MLRQLWRYTGAVVLLGGSLGACNKSFVGPDISGRGYDEADEGGGGGNGGGSGGGGDNGGGGSDSATCSRGSGHNVYYYGSTIALSFNCGEAVASVSESGMPAFLASTVAGSGVNFDGTAPAAESEAAWSFGINGLATAGDAASLTTQIISTNGLGSSIPATADLEDNNDVEIEIVHTSTLDAAWDGSFSDVILSAEAIATDMHGVALYADCDGASVPYLCNGSAASNGQTIEQGLNLRWPWSAFDQGDYYLTISPRLTIEAGVTDLADQTLSFTIPIQTAGNVAISHASNVDGATYNDTKYTYSAAIGSASSAVTPVVGVIYVADDTKHSSFFRRLVIDRGDDPDDGSSDGVTESSELVVSTANSTDFNAKTLSGGGWATLGTVTTPGGKQNVYFNRVSNSPTTPASVAAVELTDFDATDNIAESVAMTDPFTDTTDGQTRLGFAFVRNNTVSGIHYLTVAKANPAGTNAVTVVDDSDYGADPADFEIAGADNSVDMDRAKISWIAESGTGYFYVVYRRDTDIRVTKLYSEYDGGHGATSATLASGVFADATTSNFQTVDLALGTRSGATVAAIVYRRNADGLCYFKRIDSTLATISNPLQLSTGLCYFPTVHFNPASGRFVVTQAERNGLNNYDIVKTEVTIGAAQDDTKSANVVISETGATTPPIKLVTDFYPQGNWMAVFYRKFNTNVLSFHGYHVSDQ